MPTAYWKDPELAGSKCCLLYRRSMVQKANNALDLNKQARWVQPQTFFLDFGIGNSKLDHSVHHEPGWEQTQRGSLSLAPSHLFLGFPFSRELSLMPKSPCPQIILLALWSSLLRWRTWPPFLSPDGQVLNPAASELWSRPLVLGKHLSHSTPDDIAVAIKQCLYFVKRRLLRMWLEPTGHVPTRGHLR